MEAEEKVNERVNEFVKNLNLVTWKGARKHKRKYCLFGDINLYDNLENREKDVKESANFCNSYTDLLSLENELENLKELGSLENTLNRLRRRGKLNALKNLYALGESASKVASAGEDFREYEREAFEIAEKYGMQKRVKKEFRKLAENYLEKIYGFSDFVTNEFDDFVESRNRFNSYKNNALELAEKYGFDKREILKNLNGGIRR